MKVKNITLENYRSAKVVSVELQPNLNVFVGINGSGKTTLLDAMNNSLSWLVNRILAVDSKGSDILQSDIRNNTDFSSINLICENNTDLFSWENIGNALGTTGSIKSNFSEVTKLAKIFQQNLKDKSALPVIAFYPTSRSVSKSYPDIKHQDHISIFDTYENYNGSNINYKSFFEWFRIQDDIENERALSRLQWMKRNFSFVFKNIKSFELYLGEYFYKESKYLNVEIFNYVSGTLSNEKLISEDPTIVFREFSRILTALNKSINSTNDSLLIDLDYGLHKLEMVSETTRTNYDNNDNLVKLLIENINLVREFSLSNENKLQLISFIWEILTLSTVLNLWWFSKEGIKRCRELFLGLVPRLLAEEDGFNDSIKTFSAVFSKIVKAESILQQKLKGNGGHEIRIVTKAIEQFLPDYTDLRVTRIPYSHMLINKGEEEFDINHLSDGEKNLIILVGDIARRLAIANPKSSDPLKGDGIILIDEIDLHLHPKWQRIMIPQLLKTFPNCQFIVTTHSPQVISHVQPENLFILKNENNELSVSKAIESYGKNTDRILEDILGVESRPKEIKDAIKRLYRLIDDLELEEAKKEVDRLSKVIVGGDPDLSKAKVLIRRKEILGK